MSPESALSGLPRCTLPPSAQADRAVKHACARLTIIPALPLCISPFINLSRSPVHCEVRGATAAHGMKRHSHWCVSVRLKHFRFRQNGKDGKIGVLSAALGNATSGR